MDPEILSQIEELHIGPFVIYTYGLIVGISVAVCILLFLRRLPAKITERTGLYISIFLIILLTILFGRISYVLLHLDEFHSIKDIVQMTSGGTTIFGVFAGALIGAIATWKFYLQRLLKKTTFLGTLDLFILGVPLTQSIGRIANYINQELYGPPTNVPWCIKISDYKRITGYEKFDCFHPAFLYEAILNILNFIIINIYFQRVKAQNGEVTGLYLFNYGIIRIITERFRIDTEAFWGPVKAADIVSSLLIILGISIFLYAKIKNKNNHHS